MRLDLTKNTDPERNAHWWTKERFYIVHERPSVRWRLDLWRLRALWWQPRFFLSSTWRLANRPGLPAGKFRGWQCYLGWGKCDPTRTREWWRTMTGTDDEQDLFILTWTIVEMFALRLRDLDERPVWSNQGGA